MKRKSTTAKRKQGQIAIPTLSPGKPSALSDKNKVTKSNNKKNSGLDWLHCVECHKDLAQWYLFGWEGITERDLVDFAMYGDLVAQTYLFGLRKALPPESKTGVYWQHYFERLLLAHIQRLNELLCDLAKEGRRGACGELWNQALKLNETFCELAIRNPAPFKPHARRSLFMPSVRTKNPKFTADAKAIAEAIELSEETVGGSLKDNRTRIGALTARLVGECVHEIQRSRSLWEYFFTPYQRPVMWPTTDQIKPFLNKSVDEIARGLKINRSREKNEEDQMDSHLRFFSMQKDCGVGRLHFLLLPELTKETALTWWKGAIEKMVEARFPRLLQEPHWEKELKAVSRGTTADMRKELKDYCIGKVKQFASRQSGQRTVRP